MHMVISKNVCCNVLGIVRCSQVILSPCIITWQLIGGVVVWSVVLDERGNWRDVAGVHGRHAGSSADGRGLVLQVQHSEGRNRRGEGLHCLARYLLTLTWKSRIVSSLDVDIWISQIMENFNSQADFDLLQILNCDHDNRRDGIRLSTRIRGWIQLKANEKSIKTSHTKVLILPLFLKLCLSTPLPGL